MNRTGDTSGIQLFNPSTNGPAEIEVWFHAQTGERLPPTNYGPIRASIPARSGYTLYAMNLSGMIPNTIGTATVEVTGGPGRVAGVSNNVNYAVTGDGATAYNLVNTRGQYRFPVSQTE